MSFTVRSLLPKVQPFRKDLEEERSIFAIQEAVRKVCRQTGYAQTKIITNTSSFDPVVDLSLIIPATHSVYRLHLVRLLDIKLLPATMSSALTNGVQYEILSQGTSDFTLVGAANNSVGTLFTATGTTPGTGYATVYNNNAINSAWKVLYEYNQTAINNAEAYPNYSNGFPSGWTYLGEGKVSIYPNPDIPYRIEVTYSYIPVGEITDIPLPQEAEEAIVGGALATLLMLPGVGQNISLSKDREVLHNRELDFLKANALLGQSGRPRATGKTLATRAIRAYDNRWQ